jgi:rubrerythrin
MVPIDDEGNEIRTTANPPVVSEPIAKEVYREREVITREIVKIRCRHCGTLFEEKQDRCPHCGAGP